MSAGVKIKAPIRPITRKTPARTIGFLIKSNNLFQILFGSLVSSKLTS
jgi:hypothetical protein